jgi:Glucose/sorbosone dehydrogenases
MTNLLASGLESVGFPLAMAFAPDGRVFLSERVGRLWEINGDSYRVVHHFSTVPLLIHNETGLLGIAIDPDFPDPDYIYCYYTIGTSMSDMKNRVVRLKVSGPIEEVLLDNIPAGPIHCGGILAFGPDKTLYIGVGVDDKVKEMPKIRLGWMARFCASTATAAFRPTTPSLARRCIAGATAISLA